MQATITYLLSEQAQKNAMLATGQPIARKHMVSEELPSELFSFPLVKIAEDGSITCALDQRIALDKQGQLSHNSSSNWSLVPIELEALPSSGIEAIQIISARIAEKSARVIAEEMQRKADADAKWSTDLTRHRANLEALRSALDADPEATPSMPSIYVPQNYSVPVDLAQLGSDLTAEIDQRRKAAQLKKEREEAIKETAKADYIAAWFADLGHADEATRQQFSDGLLCRKTALSIVADAAFGSIEEYKPKLCADRHCSCGRKDIDCVPRAHYPAFRALRGTLPKETTYELEQVRECLRDDDGYAEADEDATGPRYAVLVKMPVGPFIFERLVKL